MRNKSIINLYWYETDNIGDEICGVFRYFDFPIPFKQIDIKRYKEHIDELKDSFIIIGGGGHIHLPSPDYNNGKIAFFKEIADLTKWTVMWGVGTNVNGSEGFLFPEGLSDFLLLGVRDNIAPVTIEGKFIHYVPCPSCMDPIFDKKFPSELKSVVYRHKATRFDMHEGTNLNRVCEGIQFYEAINFLGAAHTVFTDSYHGAYWSLLLNKNVVIFKPLSSKFFYLHDNVMLKGKPYPSYNFKSTSTFLEECRMKNLAFYNLVLEQVWNYMEE